MGDHVAAQAHIDGSTATAAHPVAAPAGVHEVDAQRRETREHVSLGEGRIQALVGDAVAIKHHRVAILQGKVLRCRHAAQSEREAAEEFAFAGHKKSL